MSADTTVVIAAYHFKGDSELSYTAKVVQAVENFWYYEDERDSAFARKLFVDDPWPWFKGRGGLIRAKQFASILAEETRENGILEYENRPIIEIAEDRTYHLSRHGRRKSDEQSFRNAVPHAYRDIVEELEEGARLGRPIPNARDYEPGGSRYGHHRSR